MQSTDDAYSLQLVEVKNGRLAMIAFGGKLPFDCSSVFIVWSALFVVQCCFFPASSMFFMLHLTMFVR